VVELEGMLSDGRTRRALREIAEAVPGVEAAQDGLAMTNPDPIGAGGGRQPCTA